MAASEEPRTEGAPAGEEIVGSEPPRATATRRHHAIAPLESLIRRAEDCSGATGQSLDEASVVVVDDLERAAAALNARTAPLVPGCGVLVAVTGLLLKAEPSSDGIAEFFVGISVLFAIGGFSFLTRGLFLYSGRQMVGLSPTFGDIAFAHDSLLRKHKNTHRGGVLAGIGLACLLIGMLFGVNISLSAG